MWWLPRTFADRPLPRGDGGLISEKISPFTFREGGEDLQRGGGADPSPLPPPPSTFEEKRRGRTEVIQR